MKGDLLVVDDQPNRLNLLKDLLSAQGYEVRTATTGFRALRMTASHPPELILLNVNLPGMSGLEVCRRLKVETATAAVPVLFLGAQFDLTDKLAAFEAGGQDFIARPFVAAELLARVRCHLRLYQKQHELEAQVDRALASWAGAYDALQALSQPLVEVRECQRRHLTRGARDEQHSKSFPTKVGLQ